MDPVSSSIRKFAIHGPAVEIDCAVPSISTQLDRFLQPFSVTAFPEGFTPTRGRIELYDPADIARHLSPAARWVAQPSNLMEIFQDEERFWIIDERWGMAQVNTLKGQWRSWILPRPKLDALRCTEMAVMWPLAQLLRGKGLHLLPAVSAVREGWAVLILSEFGLEPELTAMIRSGYRLIGQRWTAVRQEEGRLALMHMPGFIERTALPRLRGETDAGAWADLTQLHRGTAQNHAFCDAVLVTEPGRRPRAHLRHVMPAGAANMLRRNWPIAELHPHRRQGQLAAKLAQHCLCAEVQLSRNPKDLLALLHSLNDGSAVHSSAEKDLALTPWADLTSLPNAA